MSLRRTTRPGRRRFPTAISTAPSIRMFFAAAPNARWPTTRPSNWPSHSLAVSARKNGRQTCGNGWLTCSRIMKACQSASSALSASSGCHSRYLRGLRRHRLPVRADETVALAHEREAVAVPGRPPNEVARQGTECAVIEIALRPVGERYPHVGEVVLLHPVGGGRDVALQRHRPLFRRLDALRIGVVHTGRHQAGCLAGLPLPFEHDAVRRLEAVDSSALLEGHAQRPIGQAAIWKGHLARRGSGRSRPSAPICSDTGGQAAARTGRGCPPRSSQAGRCRRRRAFPTAPTVPRCRASCCARPRPGRSSRQ